MKSFRLSKICAGVNPQLQGLHDEGPEGCQRSVLVSIHSVRILPLRCAVAVKDLCWCQSTAEQCCGEAAFALSKICAGVNPQQRGGHGRPALSCQRSVLVSIHSWWNTRRAAAKAVKDLCWCQSTASAAASVLPGTLSKICAGVNPQHLTTGRSGRLCCQRSVLVSIHSYAFSVRFTAIAVKDLCWCQSTAALAQSLISGMLSKICAGVNPQPN